jgi:hypothetical protein
MTIELMPELGVEITADMPYIDLRERAEAACRSALLLEKHGLDLEPTAEDKEAAAKLTSAYAEDPERTSKLTNNVRASALTAASLINIRDYLDEYGKQVVTHAVEMRHLVTNRLLEESRNPDPRIRIRALELLGKHSDVGLFSEKQEVTITHQTTDELREKLRAKLQRLIRKGNPDAQDAPVTLEMGGEIIDVDAELGLTRQDAPENTLLEQNKPEIREKTAKPGDYFEPEPALDSEGPDIDPEDPDGEPVQ